MVHWMPTGSVLDCGLELKIRLELASQMDSPSSLVWRKERENSELVSRKEQGLVLVIQWDGWLA
jgi:hypothetical protein